MGIINNSNVFPKVGSISIPTEPIGNIPLISSRTLQKARVRILTLLLSLKLRFETPLSGLKRRTLRTVVLV
jgi:hypothetical protein